MVEAGRQGHPREWASDRSEEYSERTMRLLLGPVEASDKDGCRGMLGTGSQHTPGGA